MAGATQSGALTFVKNGKTVFVSNDNPLPTSGAGGAADITAVAPLVWDSEASTMSLDAGTVGADVLSADTKSAARSAIGAGTSSFSGAYGDLSGTPSIPDSPDDIGAATAAQGAKADSAVQPGDSGLIDPQPAIADLTAAPTMEDFNGLLSALRSAGVIASA